MAVAFGALRLALSAYAGALRAGAPRPAGVPERLAMLPADAPVERPVTIRWNDRQVPFIEAETDQDLAVALGVVHAHLRVAQIEMMRRVATGRLSEVIGMAAVGLDQAIRTIDFVRAGREAASALSPEARDWMEGFLGGLNHQIGRATELPHEFEVLGIRPEQWSFDELMAVSRLASTDFTWKVWMRLLKLRGRSDWDEIWSRLIGGEVLPEPSIAGGDAPLVEAMEAFGRGGSNAYAVSGARTASGKPLLGSDPHLSIQLPNLWLIVGLSSPSYHAAGLMVPAVPVLGLGRNRHIAWGGTNLHAASSELVSLGGQTDGIRTRRETIDVRWAGKREVAIRDSSFGPVMSDVPLMGIGGGEMVALHWMGHRPSDEVTPFLRVARAKTFKAFHDALDDHAIPGLNMIYADGDGHIGQAIAARLPRRPHEHADDLVSRAEALDHWRDMVTSRDLPYEQDPQAGFVASANNAPPKTDVSISRFFSPDDRVERLRQVLGSAERLEVADLAQLQLDVASLPARRLRDRLVPLLAAAQGAGNPFTRAIADWNGEYREESVGALAFELLLHHLVHRLHERKELYLASWEPWALLHRDLDNLPAERLRQAVGAAAGDAARAFRRLGVWGNAHRLRLAHAFFNLPLLGRRYLYEERGVGGSNETLMKTRHGFSKGRHRTGFGAQARFIADLADEDANHFVLLGGQDGWLGSSTFVDQASLWREGRHMRMPLRPESVAEEFPHVTVLKPATREG